MEVGRKPACASCPPLLHTCTHVPTHMHVYTQSHTHITRTRPRTVIYTCKHMHVHTHRARYTWNTATKSPTHSHTHVHVPTHTVVHMCAHNHRHPPHWGGERAMREIFSRSFSLHSPISHLPLTPGPPSSLSPSLVTSSSFIHRNTSPGCIRPASFCVVWR